MNTLDNDPKDVRTVQLSGSVDSSLENLIRICREDGSNSPLLIKAERRMLSADLLEKCARIATEMKISFGVIPSLDDHSTRFKGRESHDTNLKWLLDDKSTTRELLSGITAFAAVGHGDGTHLKLGDIALCGALPQEYRQNNSLTSSCNYEQRYCVKQSEFPNVVFAHEWAPDLAILLSCNSINVGSEVTDNADNLAYSFWLASDSCVIGFTRQTEVKFETLALINEMAGNSTTGQLVLALNQNRDLTHDGVAILLGDPMRKVPSFFGDTNPTNPGLLMSGTRDPKLLTIMANDYRSREDSILTSSIIRLYAGHYLAIDMQEELQRDEDQLHHIQLLTLALISRMNSGDELSLTSVEKLNKAESIQSKSFASLSRMGLLAESHPGSGVGDLLLPALRSVATRELKTVNQICDQCGGIIREWCLRSLIGGMDRTEFECSACGTQANIPGHGDEAHPRLVSPRLVSRGEKTRLRLLDMPDTEISKTNLAHVQVRNKAYVTNILDEVVPLSQLATDGIDVSIDANTAPDLHSVRVAFRSVTGIWFFRRLFAVKP